MIHSDPILLDKTGKSIVEAINRIVPTEKEIDNLQQTMDTMQQNIDTQNTRISSLEAINLSIVDGKVCLTFNKGSVST